MSSLDKVWMCGLIGLCAACGGDDGGGETRTATATFTGTNGQTVSGTATFTASGDAVSLTVNMTAAPEGVHGMHIHQMPACGNEGMDAGSHWDDDDGAAGNHHLPPGTGHLGDLGNVTIDANGAGTLTFSNPAWTLGDGTATDVVPHAIIFHQSMDDGQMPSSGMRWGCAVIAMVP
jgi:Cu-Zn family superoxide dismutase